MSLRNGFIRPWNLSMTDDRTSTAAEANLFYVYILVCSNDHYYTGSTRDVHTRYQSHRTGTARCRYTLSFPPKRLVCCWRLEGKRGTALRIESWIKKQSRTRKELLVQRPGDLKRLLELEWGKTPAIQPLIPEEIDRLNMPET